MRNTFIRTSAAAICAGLLTAGCSSETATDSTKGGYISSDGGITRVAPAERKPAPGISGVDLDGNPVSLAKLKGKVVVINIWGSWCPPCRKETPALNAVATTLKPEGVEFLGIAVRESPQASRAFAKAKKVPYPSISDESGKFIVGFTDSLPAVAIPTTYVIDADGRVATRILDKTTESTLTAVVTDVLEGR